jgi:hypothetical protein
MLRGSKLSTLSMCFKEKPLWGELLIFEKYASPTASLSKLTHPNRIAKPGQDSEALATAKTTELVVVVLVAVSVVKNSATLAVVKFMSLTFVSNPLFNLC